MFLWHGARERSAMFILPIPRSPGEHGEEDHSGGMIARGRRAFSLNIHMGVNGFIVCALLIQAVSIAGIMPAQVWMVQPGYAIIVCIGLMTLSACILFSLKRLLTQFPREQTRKPEPVTTEEQPPSPLEKPNAVSAQADMPVALVLQSSRTVQTIIEKSLAKVGIGALCVSDEPAAERSLRAGGIGLLIADVTLHASNRSVALRGLCNSCRGKGIPVLALVAETRDAQQFSADASVAMPIIPDELARRALELMRRPSLQPDSGTLEPELVPQRELPKLEPDPLDARALADLEKLGGRDFVRDIVAQFVADAAAVLASLTAAISSRDPKAFREQAHALRSCAANVGAQNVYRMCLAWRDLDAQEIAASGTKYMQMLEEEFERVRGALAPMLQQRDGSGPESQAA
jgi:HPt (histidine-containing phosphotransfer) domain-containing protein